MLNHLDYKVNEKKNQLCLFVTYQMGKQPEFSSVSKKMTFPVTSGHLTNTDYFASLHSFPITTST